MQTLQGPLSTAVWCTYLYRIEQSPEDTDDHLTILAPTLRVGQYHQRSPMGGARGRGNPLYYQSRKV